MLIQVANNRSTSLALLCLAQIGFAQVSISSATVKIFGTVTDAQSSQVLSGVKIRCAGVEAVTDSNGKYELSTSVPCSLQTSLAGYVTRNRIPQSILIRPNLSLLRRDIEMLRSSTLKVTATVKGEGIVAGAKVLLLRAIGEGKERSSVTIAEGNTDSKGQVYLRDLPEGKYFLAALPSSDTSAKSRSAGPDVVMTFYPGSTDFEGALPISIQAGDSSAEAIIEMARSQFFTVSGKLTNSGGGLPSDLPRAIEFVRLISREGGTLHTNGTPLRLNRASILISPDGTFRSQWMPPGSYEATALVKGSIVKLGAVVLGKKNLEGVVFDMPQTLEVSGVLTYEGRESSDRLPRILNFLDIDQGSQTLITMVNDSGEFKIPKAFAGRYRVIIANNSAGLYVKSVNSNPGKDVSFVGGGEQKLSLTVAKSQADIMGSASLSRSTISITPVPFGPLVSIERNYAFVESDDKGGFQSSALPPGDYRVCAWAEDLDREELMKAISDPGRESLLQSRCKSVQLGDKNSVPVHIKSIVVTDLNQQ